MEKSVKEKIPEDIGIITFIELLLLPICFIVVMIGVTNGWLDFEMSWMGLLGNLVVFELILSLVLMWRLRANKVVMIGYGIVKFILFYFWFCIFVLFSWLHTFEVTLYGDDDASEFEQIDIEETTENTIHFEMEAKSHIDDYEPLTKDEWVEFKKQEEPFTLEQLARILRTFEGTEVEKYIHFYGYAIHADQAYTNFYKKQIPSEMNFDEYDKDLHVYLTETMAPGYELIEEQSQGIILPEDTESYEYIKGLITLMFLELSYVNNLQLDILDSLAMLEDEEIVKEIKEDEEVAADFNESIQELRQSYEETIADFEGNEFHDEMLKELKLTLHPEFIEKIDNQPFN